MTMKHSRPGGMSESELEKTRRRLGGGTTPNASGARQEAPAILAGSEPSRELTPPVLTPEEIAAAAEHNRKNREAARLLEEETDEFLRVNPAVAAKAAADALPPDPINGDDEQGEKP